ncbi:MAG: hypothetical protein U9O94_10970 [Nanoarchaeota archaeon]|nr:hypothetical protein [Nanoarchaeota archaeon]
MSFIDGYPFNIETAQKLIIMWSPDIEFDFSAGYPAHDNSKFTWSTNFTPVVYEDLEYTPYHVWMKYKVGDKGTWSPPTRINYPETVKGEQGIQGVQGDTGARGLEGDKGASIYIKYGDSLQNEVSGTSPDVTYVAFRTDGGQWSEWFRMVGLDGVGTGGTGLPGGGLDGQTLQIVGVDPEWVDVVSYGLPPIDVIGGVVSHRDDLGYRHVISGGTDGYSLTRNATVKAGYEWIRHLRYDSLDDKMGIGDIYNVYSADKIMRLMNAASTGFYTVGTGGHYDTVLEAIQDGKFYLEILNDIVEPIGWGYQVHGIKLFLYSKNRSTISMSVPDAYIGTTMSNIYANNIKFGINGTNLVFGHYTRLFLDDCDIIGDNSNNTFLLGTDSYLDGTVINIDTGSAGNITINSIRDAERVVLNGSAAISWIYFKDGNIGVIEDNVAFGTVQLENSTVYKIEGTTTPVRFDNYSKVLGTGSNSILPSFGGTSFSIKDCNISFIGTLHHFGSIEDCTIASIGVVNQSIVFKNNIVNDSGSVAIGDDTSVINCTFLNDITIAGDNVDVTNSRSLNGTVITSGSVYNAKVVGCRTKMSIVAGGAGGCVYAGNVIYH